MGRLAGKNILITGGNSGIGLAAAQEFDREGARVAICGLNERTLQAAKETLGPGSLQAGHTAALKQLWELAYREASTLAYADAFRAIMIAFVVATLLVPLLRNVAPTPAPAQSH